MGVVQIFGLLMYAYFIGNASSIINSIKEQQISARKRETQLDKWLFLMGNNKSHKKVSPNIQNSVRKYFNYIWKYDNSSIVKDSEFMKRLPYKLRRSLIKHLFTSDIKKFDAFFYGCPE